MPAAVLDGPGASSVLTWKQKQTCLWLGSAGTFCLTQGQSTREVTPNTHRAVTHVSAATHRPLRRGIHSGWQGHKGQTEQRDGAARKEGSRSTSQGSTDLRKPEALIEKSQQKGKETF